MLGQFFSLNRYIINNNKTCTIIYKENRKEYFFCYNIINFAILFAHNILIIRFYIYRL